MGTEISTTVRKEAGQMAITGHGLQMTNLAEMVDFARMALNAGWTQKNITRPEQVVMQLQTGFDLGIPVMLSLQAVAIIGNRPCLWGDVMKAIVERSPLCEYVRETYDEATQTARCEAKRAGRPMPHVQTFSVQDAKTAHLWGKQGPWTNNPKRMLQLRARAFALRDQFADLLCGMAMAEEMQDVAPAPLKSGDVIAPQDLEQLADLSEQTDLIPPMEENDEEAEFQLAADKHTAALIASGDATPIGRGPGEMPF